MVFDMLRSKLLEALPISRAPLLVRDCERSDMGSLAVWPAYPEPYSSFTFSFADFGRKEMDSFFHYRHSQDNRITLVVDRGPTNCIGYVALLGIDWKRRETANMGIRVHPGWCSKGIGSGMLSTVRDWWFGGGMRRLCLDVASSNERAVRCYEKVGFAVAQEFWREAVDLKEANLADPKWRFLDGHVRIRREACELRFLLMELTPS